MNCLFARMIAICTIVVTPILSIGTAVAQDTAAAKLKGAVPKELAERMATEKEARKACKIEICKAFAAPTGGDDIKCSITKTWLRSEILSRLVGGDYVWGFGHTQCSVDVSLKRDSLAKSITSKDSNLAIGEHTLICNVGKKNVDQEVAFTVDVKVSPTIVFKDGQAVSVAFGDVQTKGSSIASAAVTSVLAIDRISGLAARGTASEVNTFLYDKCKADGVVIAAQ